MMRSHSSGVMSSSVSNDSMPALVTRISTGPELGADLGERRRRPRPGRRRRPRRRARCRRPPSSSSAAACAAGAVAVEDGDPVAVGDEPAGDAEPDAGGATGDDGDPAHRGASTGSNSRCTPGEAAEDPGRLVVEAAVAGRAVVLLGEADVVHPVEDALEADPALDPGERAAGAGVGAAPEGDVGLGVGPVDAELGRALEAPRVAVGGAVEQHHRGAGRDVDAADARWCAGPGGSRSSPGSRCAAPPRGSWGSASRSARSSSWSSGCSARCFSAAASRRAVVSWPAANRKVEVRTTEVDVGHGAVGVRRQRQLGEHVLAGLAAAVLDVRGELSRRARRAGSRRGCPRLRRRPRRRWPLRPKPSRKRWWSSSGTPSTSATTSMAKGWA